MKGWKQTGSSIRFLIDSEGLGDTPNKQNCILCVQMHCLPSCEYRIDCKLEFRKQGREEDVDHKNVCALELRRLKRFSNIKSFQAFSFTFTALNGI